MKPLPLKRLLSFFLPFLLFSNFGCYQYKLLQTDASTSTLSETKQVYSYFWGIRSPRIETTNCGTNGFDRVVVRTSVGNSLVTILTLGIVSPMKVQWECAKDPPVSDKFSPDN